jgi:hypothetical protein
MTIFALLGATALWLLYSWLAAAIIGSYLSGRKGYGERPGLASGLLLNLIGPLIWLFVPARQDSLWKKVGPWGRPKVEIPGGPPGERGSDEPGAKAAG